MAQIPQTTKPAPFETGEITRIIIRGTPPPEPTPWYVGRGIVCDKCGCVFTHEPGSRPSVALGGRACGSDYYGESINSHCPECGNMVPTSQFDHDHPNPKRSWLRRLID